MKRILILLLLVILELVNIPVVSVYAMDGLDYVSNTTEHVSSVSSEVSFDTSQQEVAGTTSANPFFDAQSVSKESTPTNLFSDFANSSASNPMIINRKAVAMVSKLAKRTFKLGEHVKVKVSNANSHSISIRVLNSSGTQVNDIAINESENGGATDIDVSPKVSLRPGKYTLEVQDETGTTSTQDFTWGVLALNPNKSIYQPGETADLAMAVLDERGAMVCDADVTLLITDPHGTTTQLSTNEGSIHINSQCLSHDYSLTPDYEAHYQVGVGGTYRLQLSATTKSGTNSIDDEFKVDDSAAFDVERVTATRIYPFYSYPVTFHVKAQKDFSGTVVEYVPSSFTISSYASGSAAAQSYDGTALPNQYTNMQEAFGRSSLELGLPFRAGYVMTQGFGAKLTDPEEKTLYATYGLAGHDGLDFDLREGTPVLATDEGEVVLAGDDAYGLTVVIEHQWGKSYYGHLSKTKVTVGDHVARGQEIGLSGNTGLSTGAHLHFGIKPLHPTVDNGYYGKVDPSPFLGVLATHQDVLGASSISDDAKSKIITWNVNLKKGESISLGYNFKTPPQSPQLYTIGPLSFFDTTKQLVFQEARMWQVAVDADSTAGPNNCSTGANETGTLGGTVTWTNPNNACVAASSTTTGTLNGATTSKYLIINNFGFTAAQIPANSVIHGIQFSVSRTGTASQGQQVVDNHVYLYNNSTIQTLTTDRADTNTWNSVTNITYGSASDTWANAVSQANVISSTFGFAISAKSTGTKNETGTINGRVTATITFNQPPGAPTNDSPSNGATGVSTSSTLQMHAADAESDTLLYKVSLYSGSSTCTGTPTVYDQTSSQTGWDQANYASGATATLTPTLASGTTYSWQAAAIDQSGSNNFGANSTCTSFTTTSSGPTLDQLLRHGKWFNGSGVQQPFTF